MIEFILLANLMRPHATLLTPYTSIQFCSELKEETDRAALSGVLTQQQSDDLFHHCLDTYTRGA